MRRAAVIAATTTGAFLAGFTLATAAALGVQWLNLHRIEHAQDGTD